MCLVAFALPYRQFILIVFLQLQSHQTLSECNFVKRKCALAQHEMSSAGEKHAQGV